MAFELRVGQVQNERHPHCAGLGLIGEKRGGPLFLAGVLLIVLWMAVFSVALVPLIGLVLFCMGDTYLTVSRDRGLLA